MSNNEFAQFDNNQNNNGLQPNSMARIQSPCNANREFPGQGGSKSNRKLPTNIVSGNGGEYKGFGQK